MKSPDLGSNAIQEPPEPRIFITPRNASVSISSGQSATVTFRLLKLHTNRETTLSAAPLPQGITAAFSPQSPGNGENFTLTLTAAPNITPAEATIEVTADCTVDFDTVPVTVNAQATGQVRPKYQLLTVLYAPPGTN